MPVTAMTAADRAKADCLFLAWNDEMPGAIQTIAQASAQFARLANFFVQLHDLCDETTITEFGVAAAEAIGAADSGGEVTSNFRTILTVIANGQGTTLNDLLDSLKTP